MQASKLEDIFLMTLKDMYHGEKQIAKALPKMAKHAESRQLKEALNHHLDETKGQLARLERVFQLMDKPVRGETCEAVKGLLEEGEELMEKAANGAVCDAGIIGVSQAIEHYEMARYGTLIAWARQLGLMEATNLLEETLKQERKADATLNDIALHEVNRKAA
jgi:ferritin-like metal-binding protein YciE